MASSDSSASAKQPDGGFATTHWSLVLRAGSANASTQAREALAQLCQTYWYPLYAFVRRQGHSPHDAQDLTQEFFARLLERNAIGSVDRERGRFRAFLLASLKNFLRDEWDKLRAQKRGGGARLLSLDDADGENRFALEPVSHASPEREFDRNWARWVLERALDALEREQSEAGKSSQFERLRPFLTDATDNQDYSAVGTELAVPPNTVAVTVRRLRHRYRELVRAQIAETVAFPGDVDQEMGHLLAAMRG